MPNTQNHRFGESAATDTPTPESKLHDDVRGFPHLAMAAVAWPKSTWSVCENKKVRLSENE
jgi:hypothetical protein